MCSCSRGAKRDLFSGPWTFKNHINGNPSTDSQSRELRYSYCFWKGLETWNYFGSEIGHLTLLASTRQQISGLGQKPSAFFIRIICCVAPAAADGVVAVGIIHLSGRTDKSFTDGPTLQIDFEHIELQEVQENNLIPWHSLCIFFHVNDNCFTGFAHFWIFEFFHSNNKNDPPTTYNRQFCQCTWVHKVSSQLTFHILDVQIC